MMKVSVMKLKCQMKKNGCLSQKRKTYDFESDPESESPVYTELTPVSGPLQEDIEAESIDNTSDNSVFGKDRQTQWMSIPFPEPRTPRKNILKIPKNRTPFTTHVHSAADTFSLFINNAIIETIVNIEGRRERGQNGKIQM